MPSKKQHLDHPEEMMPSQPEADTSLPLLPHDPNQQASHSNAPPAPASSSNLHSHRPFSERVSQFPLNEFLINSMNLILSNQNASLKRMDQYELRMIVAKLKMEKGVAEIRLLLHASSRFMSKAQKSSRTTVEDEEGRKKKEQRKERRGEAESRMRRVEEEGMRREQEVEASTQKAQRQPERSA